MVEVNNKDTRTKPGLFLYPLKTSKNLWFFGGYGKRPSVVLMPLFSTLNLFSHLFKVFLWLTLNMYLPAGIGT